MVLNQSACGFSLGYFLIINNTQESSLVVTRPRFRQQKTVTLPIGNLVLIITTNKDKYQNYHELALVSIAQPTCIASYAEALNLCWSINLPPQRKCVTSHENVCIRCYTAYHSLHYLVTTRPFFGCSRQTTKNIALGNCSFSCLE